MKESFESVTVT